MLNKKNILLGVTGGIAAYKTASLTRLFVKAGADVRILMSATAKHFITPLTLATLSKHPVMVDFFNPENGDWNSHVELGLWADAYLVAPATANTVGKMAAGIADNLLLTTYLSAKCPVFIAPAMDLDMYRHPSVTKNLDTLRSLGITIIEPESGELASGLTGKGRMAEPETIIYSLNAFFDAPFSGMHILITAGPTYERIDPVRFVGNFSTGKMGYALAETLAQQGAKVSLVSGPSMLNCKHPNIKRINVESAQEMYEECVKIFPSCEIGIMCAAVADYTPENPVNHKIKSKHDEGLILKLSKTKDIAAELGKMKTDRQLLAGFALETDNEQSNASNKLNAKNLDFIVLNSLNDQGAGFAGDTNKITIIDAKNKAIHYELKSKTDVARDIAEYLKKQLPETKSKHQNIV
ncbi:MAG: bifunctional phosphopantothenoylcysteine decarboxylase/phosphopantothenate--cysteine ligase CoaBC [Prevotellaceae bacterium]|jgi:phosphopantothenoylcysteine decarboxylase/phosphopantothenate--cysteine ligase|nr:bifunctional phosphopantothenoylcysteine decarboxylase/phosphopantothenate--cysteine ligase CoaBC [Prevotellaceae bacterium]